MSGVDFVRFYAGRWRDGCSMISLEAEGLYIRISAFRWDAGIRVPSDRKKAAMLLRVNYNKYTKVLDELIAERLVVETADGLIVRRAETEFEAAEQAATKKRVSPVAGKAEAGTVDQGRDGGTSSDTVTDQATQQVAPQVTPQLTGLVTHLAHVKNTNEINAPLIDTDKDKEEGKNSGYDARARVVDYPHGVKVNCETISHKAFTISIPAIELGIAGRIPRDDLKSRCLAHAMQWAAEIEGGKDASLVVPSKIANFLSATLMGELNRDASANVRQRRDAATGKTPTELALERRRARKAAEEADSKAKETTLPKPLTHLATLQQMPS